MKETIEDELKNLENKHNFKLEKMKLENRILLSEDELKSTLELQRDESKGKIEQQKAKRKNEKLLKDAYYSKERAIIEEEAFRINIRSKQNKVTIRNGRLLKLLAFIAFVGSTILTLKGSLEKYTTSDDQMSTFGVVLTVIVLQSTVFIMAQSDSVIREFFMRHMTQAQFLKYASFGISVFHSFQFFAIDGDNPIQMFMNALGCVVLDFITVYCTAIASDMITLNFHNKKTIEDLTAWKNMDEADEEFESIIKNDMNGKGLNSEKNCDYEVVNFDGNNKKKNVVSCEINIEDDEIYNRFLEYIEKNCKDKSKLPGQKYLAKELGTTQNMISKIENILQYKKILDIKPNGTYWI